MSLVEIRKLTPADAVALAALRGELVESDPAAMGDEDERQRTTDSSCISGELASGQVATFGAFLAGELVGCASIQPGRAFGFDGVASISAVGVLATRRGCGAGAALVKTCLEHARRCGARGANLRVNLPNDAAQGLYESLGFAPATGDSEPAFTHDRTAYRGHDMYLDL